MPSQAPRSPDWTESKSLSPVVLLSLHVAGFLLIAAILLPTEAGMFIPLGTLRLGVEFPLVLFAVLYIVLALAWGNVLPYRTKFGLGLSAVVLPYLILLLAAAQGLDVSLPKSGLFIVLSLVDSLALLVILIAARLLARAPRGP